MTLSTDGFTLLTTIKLPGGVGGHGDWLGYDPYTQTIWLSQSPDNNEVVINANTNQLAAVLPGVGDANGNAESANNAFVADVVNNTTDEYSTSTYARVGTTSQSGTTPDGVTYVPATGQVYMRRTTTIFWIRSTPRLPSRRQQAIR